MNIKVTLEAESATYHRLLEGGVDFDLNHALDSSTPCHPSKRHHPQDCEHQSPKVVKVVEMMCPLGRKQKIQK